MPNYVPGSGNPRAKIMFVGEAPGAIEDKTGIPFNGPSGDLLWDICRELGISRSEIYTTNCVKYRPPNNDLRKLKEVGVSIDECISQLWDEIIAINPNVIVALGNTPLKYLTGRTGILKWRGSVITTQSYNFKVVPTIHPAALLHSEGDDYERKGPLKYSYRYIIKLDLMKAIRESETNLYSPPDRVVDIARDSVAVSRYFDLYRDKNIVSVDIEVEKAIPFCIGLAFNNWHAISIPLFDLWKVFKGESTIASHQLAEMWRLTAELLARPDIKVIGQNFKFDQGQLATVCGIHIANFHCDTSLLAHCIHPEFPKSLEFNTSIYTDVPYYKDEGRGFNWKKDKIERVLRYNGLDACVTYEVFEEMLKDAQELIVPGFPNWAQEFCLDYQRELHYFYTELEDVGFKTDLVKQKELIAKYTADIAAKQGELDALAGCNVNVNSNPQCSILIYQQLGFPFRKGADEDTLTALISNTKGKVNEKKCLELILLIRRLKLSKTKYFSALVDYDGRMKTSYTIAGTETGRSNTKILKPPVRPEKMGIPFQTITKHGDVGVEIREMFLADEGYVIVETDMSQAEARIVALLANDAKLLQMFADKVDIHTTTTTWIFNISKEDVNKALRFIGKTTRHAGNYGMKKHRLAEIVNTDAAKFKIDIAGFSEYKAGQVLDKFHAFSPNIRGVFHEDVKKALQDNNRVLVNPFGRYRQFFDRWSEDLFKEAFAQIPQSTVPDAIRRAGIRAKRIFAKEGIDARFLLEGHDSLIGLVKEEQAADYVQIMHEQIEVPIDFSRCTIKRGELVIPAESKIGYNYRDASNTNPKGLRDCKELVA